MTRSQRKVLEYIRKMQPVCRIDIIRARLGVSPSSISRAIHYAYRMAWIYETSEYFTGKMDCRHRYLRITEMGRRALEAEG